MNKKLLTIFTTMLLALVISVLNPTTASADNSDYYIKVNKRTNVVTIYSAKNNKPVKAMLCSAGVPTPEGTFYTPIKYRWKELIGPSYGQYSTRITGGILFHSVYYYTNGDHSTMSTSAYNLLGTLQSKGCIRLRVIDAKWIYDNCPIGTKVTIFTGNRSDDPLGRPTYPKIGNGRYTNWDPTDPNKNNPWATSKPSIALTGSRSVQYRSNFNPISRITTKDSLGNVIYTGVKTKGKVNTKKAGSYKVKFTFKDSFSKKVSTTVTFIVRNMEPPKLSGVKNRSIAAGQKINLLKGVSAKALTGKSYTSKIRVYYKSGRKYKYIKSAKKTFKKAGTYKIKYYVKGGNKKSVSKVINLKVTNKKVKLSAKNITIEYGTVFNPKSYIKITNYKGNAISKSNITAKHSVNTQKVGKYKVTYTGVMKKKKFTKNIKTITVNVVNRKYPTISGTKTGTHTISLGVNPTSLNLKSGVTAKTSTGVNITSNIKVYVNNKLVSGSTYNFNTVGIHYVTYKVIPKNGSKTTAKTFIVNVKSAPIIPEPEPETEPENETY